MKPGIYLTEKQILELKTDLPPIKQILNEIQDPLVRTSAKKGLEMAPDDMWLYPCSIQMSADLPNRLYHGPFNLVRPGGILNHLIIGSRIAIYGLKRYHCFRYKIDPPINYAPKPEWKDLALHSFLLHDACKYAPENYYDSWGEKMHRKHGLLAAEFISQIPAFKKLDSFQKKQILNSIKWHMGIFGSLPKRRFTEFERVIQEADFYSSLTFLIDVDIQLINYPLIPR